MAGKEKAPASRMSASFSKAAICQGFHITGAPWRTRRMALNFRALTVAKSWPSCARLRGGHRKVPIGCETGSTPSDHRAT
jgi:hypothetical protein